MELLPGGFVRGAALGCFWQWNPVCLSGSFLEPVHKGLSTAVTTFFGDGGDHFIDSAVFEFDVLRRAGKGRREGRRFGYAAKSGAVEKKDG